MRRLPLPLPLVPLLFCLACQAEPSESPTAASSAPFWPLPPCEPRSGEFRLRMVEQGGNCGPVDDVLIDPESKDEAKLCEGQQAVSADQCEVTSDVTCPAAKPGFRVQIVGKVFWDAAGLEGVGRDAKVYLLNKSGERECEGLYDVFYSKRRDKGFVCGVNCEPYSVRDCGGGQVQVCASGGTAYTTCGDTVSQRSSVSICGAGLACLPGPNGGAVRCQ